MTSKNDQHIVANYVKEKLLNNLVNSGVIDFNHNKIIFDQTINEKLLVETIEEYAKILQNDHINISDQVDYWAAYLADRIGSEILKQQNHFTGSLQDFYQLIIKELKTISSRSEIESAIIELKKQNDESTQKILYSTSLIRSEIHKLKQQFKANGSEYDHFSIDKESGTDHNPDAIIAYAIKLHDETLRIIIPDVIQFGEKFYYFSEKPTTQTVVKTFCIKIPFCKKIFSCSKRIPSRFDPIANFYKIYLKKHLNGKNEIKPTELEAYVISEEKYTKALCKRDGIPNGSAFYRAILFDPDEIEDRRIQIFAYDVDNHYLYCDKDQPPISFEEFKYLASKTSKKINMQ